MEYKVTESGSIADHNQAQPEYTRIEDGVVIQSFNDIWQNGDYNQVPVMIGNTASEFTGIALTISSKMSDEEKALAYKTFDPDNPKESGLTASSFISIGMIPFYSLLGSVVGDFSFKTRGTDAMADQISEHHSVYAFEFEWDEQPEPFDFLLGASHGIDVPFLFGNFPTGNNKSMVDVSWSELNRPGREKLSDAFQKYIGNFALMGDPNKGRFKLPIKWQQWQSWGEKRMSLDTELGMKR